MKSVRSRRDVDDLAFASLGINSGNTLPRNTHPQQLNPQYLEPTHQASPQMHQNAQYRQYQQQAYNPETNYVVSDHMETEIM